MSNYSEIKNFDIANAPGISLTIFLSGCDAESKCKGCFNSIAWDKNSGKEITEEFYQDIENKLSNKYIDNLVLLGGDPLAEWNLEASLKLIEIAVRLGKKIWVYTWRPFEIVAKFKDYDNLKAEELLSTNKIPYHYKKIVNNIDILIDGRFIEEKKDLTLHWRGSSNQRVIDVKQSLINNEIILYQD